MIYAFSYRLPFLNGLRDYLYQVDYVPIYLRITLMYSIIMYL